MQDLAEELFNAWLHFTAEEHVNSDIFDNFAIIHEDNPVVALGITKCCR